MEKKIFSNHFSLFFRNLSIRNKFFFTTTSMLLIVSLVLAALSSYTLWKDNTGRIQENCDASMVQTVNSVENIFATASSLARVIAPNQWVQEYYLESGNQYKTVEQKALIQSFLDTIIEPHSIISSVTIYGLDNYVVSSSFGKQGSVPKIIDWDVFGEKIELLQENWGTTLYLPSQQATYSNQKGEEQYISVLKPIVSITSGNLVAVLEICILESTISKSTSRIYSADESKTFIIDDEGMVISSTDTEEIGDSIAETDLYESLKKKEDSASFNQIIKEENEKYLVCMRKFSSLDWYVVSQIPTSVLYEQSRQQLMVIILIIFVALLISMPVSLVLANSISKPIQSLCDCMDQAAKGNLNVEIPVFGEDEVGYLAHRFTNMLAQISSLISQVTREKLARRENQLLALQAQINPHFLYNTLESISSLISLKMYNEAVSMTHSLEIFYKTALSGGKNVIPLEKEMQNVRNYLEILKIRYRDMFDYKIDFPSELGHYVIAKLTIQPLVENAIYHGIRKQQKVGIIQISCVLKGADIEICVTDNGPGFKNGVKEDVFAIQSGSYGLSNVNERIQLYFGQAYGLSIDTDYLEGARVYIRIPAVTASTETTIQLRE